jgi:UDP-glucose 6-dehydrogenase
MKIGIIGLGVVGNAVMEGLRQIDQEVSYYDIKFPDTSLLDILNTEIVFVCVPTNSTVEGKCDTSIVESVVEQLMLAEYTGIVAIKSTVIPNTTKKLIEKYNNQDICFVPEFLRQRCALADYHDNHDVLVIGTDNTIYSKICNTSFADRS